MTLTDICVYILLLIGAVLSYRAQKLTRIAAITGSIAGVCIYVGAGLSGLLLLAVFFIGGTLATKWKMEKKAAIGTAEINKGRRTAGQVLANAGFAAALGLSGWQSPDKVRMIQVMIAGSFAAAMADTLSSELGMVYGKRFFNILTLKKDTCGLDGVISFEGTLIGVIGAILIATIYSITAGWSINFYWIILAGFTGNLADSILGAALERRKFITNNMVNFLNTLAGAMVCWVLI